MNIIDYIPHGHDRAISYTRLQNLTGMTKRKVRQALSLARREHKILNLQDKKGFFRPIEGKEDDLILKFYKQENHRNNEHRETLRPIEEYFYFKGIE